MLEVFFAGLWPIIWKSILSIGVAGCLLIVAFVPLVWVPMWIRKIALWAGAIVLTWTLAYAVGIRDEHKHGLAQWNVQVDKEIESAKQDRTKSDADVDRAGDSGVLHDRYNRDNDSSRH